MSFSAPDDAHLRTRLHSLLSPPHAAKRKAPVFGLPLLGMPAPMTGSDHVRFALLHKRRYFVLNPEARRCTGRA